jgi:hypothetical protein
MLHSVRPSPRFAEYSIHPKGLRRQDRFCYGIGTGALRYNPCNQQSRV